MQIPQNNLPMMQQPIEWEEEDNVTSIDTSIEKKDSDEVALLLDLFPDEYIQDITASIERIEL